MTQAWNVLTTADTSFKAVDKDHEIVVNTFLLNQSLADRLSQEFECTKLKSLVLKVSKCWW